MASHLTCGAYVFSMYTKVSVSFRSFCVDSYAVLPFYALLDPAFSHMLTLSFFLTGDCAAFSSLVLASQCLEFPYKIIKKYNMLKKKKKTNPKPINRGKRNIVSFQSFAYFVLF